MTLKHGRLYTDPPNWIKNKKATISPICDKDKWFHYAVAITLTHEEIGRHSQRTSKTKPVINNDTWKGINYHSGKDDWKKSLRKKSIHCC